MDPARFAKLPRNRVSEKDWEHISRLEVDPPIRLASASRPKRFKRSSSRPPRMLLSFQAFSLSQQSSGFDYLPLRCIGKPPSAHRGSLISNDGDSPRLVMRSIRCLSLFECWHGTKPQPGHNPAAIAEPLASADGGDHGGGDHRPDTLRLLQSSSEIIALETSSNRSSKD
jgi:hypothetical protein